MGPDPLRRPARPPAGYGFMSFPRYGETKLMNMLFTLELARRLEGTGVTANCVHPGAVATNIGAPPKLVVEDHEAHPEVAGAGSQGIAAGGARPGAGRHLRLVLQPPQADRRQAGEAGARCRGRPSGSGRCRPSVVGVGALVGERGAIASATSAGASSGSMCPKPGSTISSAPGIDAARTRDQRIGVSRSREPTSDGGRHADRGEPGAVVHARHAGEEPRAGGSGGGDEGVEGGVHVGLERLGPHDPARGRPARAAAGAGWPRRRGSGRRRRPAAARRDDPGGRRDQRDAAHAVADDVGVVARPAPGRSSRPSSGRPAPRRSAPTASSTASRSSPSRSMEVRPEPMVERPWPRWS